MQPERWRQISGIFKSALALEPDQREAFVADQCGADESLRREVELLIESHHNADQKNFIQSPAVAAIASLLVSEDSEAEDNRDGLEAGQQLSHYRMLKKLGAGGMGEVYLAQDTRLDRTVALKILHGDVASDKRRMQRFKQEAKLASSLNQPNILTIFEFGDTDSLHFIASEYVDGATLREHLSGGQLKLTEMIDIAAQVIAALDAAHEAKIVHRDIKPENIMVRRRDRVVKVLDFGLAKLSEPLSVAGGQTDTEAKTETLVKTMPGTVLGTISYMSPEQAQGLRVDERTDLWSTGVVIYEMVAGHVPFAGVTKSHTIVDILEKEPALLESFGPGKVPPELERIVSKALAKKTDERYQTARDMLIDLRNLKRRLELDAEMQRSASPDQPNLTGATGAAVIASTGSIASQTEAVAPHERDSPPRQKVVAAIALALVLVISLIVAAAWSRRRSAVMTPVSDAVVVPERELSYWMTVQKYKSERSFGEPFRLAGEINFEKDYRLRLNVGSAQSGYLYILNQGPANTEGANSLVVLFPSPTANDGLSKLADNQRIEIPETSWIKFDAEQGTEKLWLVFSATAVPELEAVKQFVNKKDQGLISDAVLNARVLEFLRANSGTKATLEKDDELKQTTLKIPGAVLVHAIKLEHH
ncbi:MAG: eukaryotic-like serine/threonine-protein kinase [Blastocatellia bacterium]|jgi:serine/threonine protein kinase|nr:eukaryotic-like serine/threonine-protein kinase [Blastocatellia bacterium]